MVFYRKYRPQTIEQLDNAHVRDVLYSLFSTKAFPHAFLFTGPKGLGKTSTARIVAKAINCQNNKKKLDGSPKDIEPCNTCDSCISITNGTNMDILEIDGASNRGIDEIRDLREKIKLTPLASEKKVYIIDEVHMLTTEAFNALLKTLEEPPAHVVFILCTTELHKVPDTIKSRCFQIAFESATREELERSFKRIIKGEKIDIDSVALEYIAGLSEGGFRDGAKILEELVMLSKGSTITKELIEERYKVTSTQLLLTNLIESLAKKDTKKSLLHIQELVDKGGDIKYTLEQLITTLHTMLLKKVGAITPVHEEDKQKSNAFSENDYKKIIQLLSQAFIETKYAVIPQLPLELAVIEWGQGETEIQKEEPVIVSTSSAPQKQVTQIQNQGGEVWNTLIQKVKENNVSVAGVLRGCKLKEQTDKEFIIETKYKFHKEKLEEKKTHDLLTKIVQEITSKNLLVSIELIA